jgi:hypothetical protein
VASHAIDPLLVDRSDSLIQIALVSPGGGSAQSLRGLHDTGAAANFVRKDVALELCRTKIIRKRAIHTLPEPVTVIYGNNQSEQIATYVEILCTVADQSPVRLLCFVSEQSNYGLIIGRTGLRALCLLNSTLSLNAAVVKADAGSVDSVVTTDSAAV